MCVEVHTKSLKVNTLTSLVMVYGAKADLGGIMLMALECLSGEPAQIMS